jgi:REP element-mobilizing transposase RayT
MRGKPITHPNSDDLRIRTRGRLPHWELDGALYFITYRLFDALPMSAIEALKAERANIERLVTGGSSDPTSVQADEISRLFHLRLDEYLDRGYGECWLRRSDIAEIVIGAWKFFDGQRYDLITWCVMPNHVHLVMRLFEGKMLSRVLHSWKSFTALRSNEILGRSGRFWQREYYDRIIRDAKELETKIAYVVRNPEKAGLTGWPYVWRAGEERE